MEKAIFVTGGAGFIGSAVVRYLINHTQHKVINIDKLTYAGHPENLSTVEDSKNYIYKKVDICNGALIRGLFDKYQPNAVIHLAAESHVDRSIDGSYDFIKTNVLGTHTLLEISRSYWKNLAGEEQKEFRFLHVSTDEVYGELGEEGYFQETTPYDPRSPYSASKASSDHLVRAWHHTYGMPVLITNCSNNYGPYQFPEKLIPVVILKALQRKNIPVYGTGENVRDWLFVEDHVRALLKVLNIGSVGGTYNIGGNNEKKNITVVRTICNILDKIRPKPDGSSYEDQITFVTDRPGHDFRYAIDASKIKNELGWIPKESFETGIEKTVKWYLNNIKWCEKVTNNNYNFERLGTKT